MEPIEETYIDKSDWGRCYVGDLSRGTALRFEFGGEDNKPSDGLGAFAVASRGAKRMTPDDVKSQLQEAAPSIADGLNEWDYRVLSDWVNGHPTRGGGTDAGAV